MCSVLSIKTAGVGSRWGISTVLTIPFSLLALSFSFKAKSKTNKNPQNPHLPPMRAKTRPQDLLTISEDKVEEQAGFGLFGGQKASAENRDRTLSLLSISSEDPGFASRDKDLVSKNLAAISEDRIDQQVESGLLNGPKSHLTSDPVMSFPFFTFERLYSKPTSSESRPTVTDFIAAVGLADCSL